MKKITLLSTLLILAVLVSQFLAVTPAYAANIYPAVDDSKTQAGPAPTIASVTPNYGPAAGGTDVTITGTDLNTIINVNFGGSNAACYQIIGNETIKCISGPHAPGMVDVNITTLGGTVTLTDGFRYYPAPTLSSVTPSVGSVAGGTAVTVSGTDLDTVTA